MYKSNKAMTHTFKNRFIYCFFPPIQIVLSSYKIKVYTSHIRKKHLSCKSRVTIKKNNVDDISKQKTTNQCLPCNNDLSNWCTELDVSLEETAVFSNLQIDHEKQKELTFINSLYIKPHITRKDVNDIIQNVNILLPAGSQQFKDLLTENQHILFLKKQIFI